MTQYKARNMTQFRARCQSNSTGNAF